VVSDLRNKDGTRDRGARVEERVNVTVVPPRSEVVLWEDSARKEHRPTHTAQLRRGCIDAIISDVG
jgi:hypothetical protein